MTGVRALVQRPGRKMHLATFDLPAGVWLPFCPTPAIANDERTVVWRFGKAIGDGVNPRLVGELRGIVSERPAGDVCRHCERFLLLIQLLEQDRAHGIAHEYRLTA